MSEEVEIRPSDSVAKEIFPLVENFYSGLDDSWSRFVPERFQSSGYYPNRLTVNKNLTGEPIVNISCYREINSSKFFLSLIGRSTPRRNIKIEAFLAEVPEKGVVQMQDQEHGCPERRTIIEKMMYTEGKELSGIVSETTEMMNDVCEELESNSTKELLSQAEY